MLENLPGLTVVDYRIQQWIWIKPKNTRQVVVHDADFTAIETLVEERATVQKTGFPDKRAGFIIQIMHFWNPPLLFFHGSRLAGIPNHAYSINP